MPLATATYRAQSSLRASLRFAVLAIVLTALPAMALGQIAISSSDVGSDAGKVYDSLESLAQDTTGIAAVLSENGENATWDFSGFTFQPDYDFMVTYLTDPSGLPDGDLPEFASSNFIQEVTVDSAPDSSSYIYEDLTASEVSRLGFALIFNNDTTSIVYDSPLTRMLFPLQYGVAWEDSTSYEIVGSETTRRIEAEVDGWGTLTTSAGTYDAIRLKVVQYQTSFGFDFVTTIYDFLTHDNVEIIVEVSHDSFADETIIRQITREVTNVGIDDAEFTQDGLQINAYPNPATDHVTIEVKSPTPDTYAVEIYDVRGARVASFPSVRASDTSRISWVPENRAAGLYLIRATNGRNSVSSSLIVK